MRRKFANGSALSLNSPRSNNAASRRVFLDYFIWGTCPVAAPCRNFEIFCIFLETNSDAALYEGEPTTSVVDAYRLKIRGERYV